MTHKCVDQKLVYSALRINVLGTLYIVRACTVITAVQKTSNEAFQVHVHNHAFKDPSPFLCGKKIVSGFSRAKVFLLAMEK